MTKPSLDDLLASARGDDATPDQLASLDRKIAPLFVLPPGGGGGGGSGGSGPAPSGGGHGAIGGSAAAAGAGLKHAVALKWAAGVIAAAASVGGVVAVTSRRTDEVRPVAEVATTAPRQSTVPEPGPEPPALDPPVVPPVVPDPTPPPSGPPASTRPDTSASSLVAESQLLERARSALQGGHASAALETCERHAHRYPRGQLREERERIAIEALVALGRRDAAATRAARFDRTFPDSVQSERIHALLDHR